MSKQKPDLKLVPRSSKPGGRPCETTSDCSILSLDERGYPLKIEARAMPYNSLAPVCTETSSAGDPTSS